MSFHNLQIQIRYGYNCLLDKIDVETSRFAPKTHKYACKGLESDIEDFSSSIKKVGQASMRIVDSLGSATYEDIIRADKSLDKLLKSWDCEDLIRYKPALYLGVGAISASILSTWLVWVVAVLYVLLSILTLFLIEVIKLGGILGCSLLAASSLMMLFDAISTEISKTETALMIV
jgi:hypothetical protein